MKKEYRNYIAGIASIAIIYSLAKSISGLFIFLSCIIFLYMLYLAISLLWSLIKQKHTWRSILKREAVAVILLFAAMIVGYATESPEAKQAGQERRAQEKYDKQAKYEEWMAQKQDQDQALQTEAIDNELTDELPTQEDYDKQAQYEDWQNYMAQQAYDKQAQYEEWQNYMSQHANDEQNQTTDNNSDDQSPSQEDYDKQAQYEEWQNYMAQQAYDKQAQYEEWIQYSLDNIKEKLAKAEPDATLNIYNDGNGEKILDVTYDIHVNSDKDASTEVKNQFYRILKATHPSPSNPISEVNIHGMSLLVDNTGVYQEGEGLTCIFTAKNAKEVNFDSDGNAYSCIKNAQFYREVPFK